MAIALLGTETLTLTAESSSVSVTVPSGTDFAVLVWDGYALAGLNISSMTLDSVARTNVAAASAAGTDGLYGHGMEYWLTPDAGSQTLAWTWTAEPLGGEGPAVQILYFSGVDQTTPVRDGDIHVLSGGGSANTVTIDSTATDYVLGFCASWQNSIDCSDAGQTNITATFTGGSRFGRCGTETSPGSSSTTFDTSGTDANMSAISLVEAEEGGEEPAPAPIEHHSTLSFPVLC